jgi:hypothetical protein
MSEWHGCHYCGPGVRGYVYWTHSMIDVERHTCYHHARELSIDLGVAGWIRVTEDEWFTEANRLEGAL